MESCDSHCRSHKQSAVPIKVIEQLVCVAGRLFDFVEVVLKFSLLRLVLDSPHLGVRLHLVIRRQGCVAVSKVSFFDSAVRAANSAIIILVISSLLPPHLLSFLCNANSTISGFPVGPATI